MFRLCSSKLRGDDQWLVTKVSKDEEGENCDIDYVSSWVMSYLSHILLISRVEKLGKPISARKYAEIEIGVNICNELLYSFEFYIFIFQMNNESLLRSINTMLRYKFIMKYNKVQWSTMTFSLSIAMVSSNDTILFLLTLCFWNISLSKEKINISKEQE